MAGALNRSRLLHLGPLLLGHLLHPRAKVGSLGPGVRARAVNLVVYGPRRVRAASRAAIMGKVSPPFLCIVLSYVIGCSI